MPKHIESHRANRMRRVKPKGWKAKGVDRAASVPQTSENYQRPHSLPVV
jgi:hypothetical protein